MADPRQEGITSLARGVMGAGRPEAQTFSQIFLNDLARFRNAKPEQQPAIQQEVFRRALKDYPQQIPGFKGLFNLAPDAPNLIVRLPNGNVMKVPRDAELPSGAVILNKTNEEVRASMPAQLRPPEPPPPSAAPGAPLSASGPAEARASLSPTYSFQAGQPPIVQMRQPAPAPSETVDLARYVTGRPAAERPPIVPSLPPSGRPATPAADAARARDEAAAAARSEPPYRGPWSQNLPPETVPRVPLQRPAPFVGREPDVGLPLGLAGLGAAGATLAHQRGDIYGLDASMRARQEEARIAAEQRAEAERRSNLEQQASLREAGYSTAPSAAPAYQSPDAVGMGTIARNPLPEELRGDQFSEVAGYTGESPTRMMEPAAAAATQTARQVMSSERARDGEIIPPPARPAGRTGANAEGAQGAGFFSNLFSDPYAGKSARDLYYQAQDMQRAGDEYGSNLLTQRAMSMERGGEKARGGAAGSSMGSKDAALHKALEIIHHMLTRR